VPSNISDHAIPGQDRYETSARPDNSLPRPALHHPESESRVIAYQFVAMPPIAFELCRQGKLEWSDLGTLEILIGYQHVPGSCWTTIGAIAAKMASNGRSLETNERAIRRSFARIFEAHLVERKVVPIPDPQEPVNKTGYRYDFLWASDSVSPRIFQEEPLTEGGGGHRCPPNIGGHLRPKERTPMSEMADTGVPQGKIELKRDRNKSSVSRAREAQEDDDDVSMLSEERPEPQGDSRIPDGQASVPEPQPIAMPAPMVPAVSSAAVEDLSAPVPRDLVDWIESILGPGVAGKVVSNPQRVRTACKSQRNSNRDVLMAATRKMKRHMDGARSPFGLYLTIMEEIARDGIPEEFSAAAAAKAELTASLRNPIAYFKAAPVPANNDELKRETIKCIRETMAAVEAEKRAEIPATVDGPNAGKSRGSQFPDREWEEKAETDPYIRAELARRRGLPEENKFAEAV
jgi:hypothetical protein